MAKFGPQYRAYREATWDRLLYGLLAMAAGLIAIFGASVTAGLHPTMGLFGYLAFFLGGAVAFHAWNRPDYAERRGRVFAKDGVLTIDDRTVVRRAKSTTLRQTSDDGFEVEVYEGPRAARVVVAVDTRRRAEELREALHVAEEARASFRVAATSVPAGRLLMAFAVALVGIGGIFGVMMGQPMCFLLTAIGLALLRVRATATVGADGIVLGYFGGRTFVPFSDVVKVESDYGVVLHRRDGSLVRIRETLNEDVRERMLARIEDARASVTDTAVTEQLLARGEREEKAWREELRSLASPGYRRPSLERDRLWEVCENPGAEPSARLAATILLHESANADDRERLTRVGESVSSPELRDQMFEELGGDPEEEASDADGDAKLTR